jgi:hypothetical protein
MSALTGTVPTAFGAYLGTPPDQFCVFTIMSTPEAAADDVENERMHYVYLELYSTSNPIAKKTAIHTAMKAAGFMFNEERGYYDQATKTSQFSMTWTYLEAV